MKRKKFIFILGITVFTIFLVAIFFINNHGVKSQDEWKLTKKQYDEDFFVDKWSYIHGDGSFTKENWEKIDNKWYYFDFEGLQKLI